VSLDNVTRRSVLRGVAVMAGAAVAGFALARTSDAAGTKDPAAAANGYGPATKSGGTALTTVDKIPASGGVVLGGAGVVVTKDKAGDVHAFSATCTHQGCTVSTVADGTIDCPCHGSRFDATTGAVVRGPATRPLAPVPVTVQGDRIIRT
jgi:Rieske Fe-S protein